MAKYIKKLSDTNEIIEFQKKFNEILGYSNVPYDYFKDGECHAMYDDGKLVAGFCLVPGFLNLRAVKQLPNEKILMLLKQYSHIVNKLADFTGYFITDKKYGLKFTMHLVKTCLFHRCRYFIYSYLVTEYGLERYYGSGDPIRVHTGKPEHLTGHHDVMEDEHVEILTKWGIIKIFWYRTKRWIKILLHL